MPDLKTARRVVGTCNWCKTAIYSDQDWGETYTPCIDSVFTSLVTVRKYHRGPGPCPTPNGARRA